MSLIGFDKELGFGGGAISGEAGGYGFGPMSEAESSELLNYAYQQGIRCFDTAPIYGFGSSEERFGKVFGGNSPLRNSISVVTKTGLTWDDQKKPYVDNSAKNIRKMVHESLKRMDMEYIDVYLIHWSNPNCSIEESFEELAKLKEEKLVRAVGACNFSVEELQRAGAVCKVDVCQNKFSLLDKQVQDDVLPYCIKYNIKFMSYGTLAKGMLAGSINSNRTFHPSDMRTRDDGKFLKLYEERKPQIEAFERLAHEAEYTPAALAYQWTLSQPGVNVTLCGTKSKKQLDELLTVKNRELSSKILNDLNN